ncbi:MaoC family dehydratase [Novosphingobium sp. KCTC 2891]|uniref:MaoC family dehydratase n=1 Tax=Novosphingobium sp. KCTC 2891 TaxID=2989730 RepID=UPI00222249E9|nr:MaoC family dehydratase [Novosphingobium sp. KCTC 2891]MCW1381828.1 MaoC family dehydratase [Novosphingobium sp. KCTC 2891]
MQYYEDLVPGSTDRFGSYAVTREEVIDFASKYDPQPFHLDDEAAKDTFFGRLSASGWHTCAMTMAMLVEELKKNEQAGLGSPGVDELRWVKPVYPGDTLSVERLLVDKRRSGSRPEMGSFRNVVTVTNQHGDVVMTMKSTGFIRTRQPGGAD